MNQVGMLSMDMTIWPSEGIHLLRDLHGFANYFNNSFLSLINQFPCSLRCS
ncbi:hypothetical protein SLEP1_g31042 [Rubroshorea leprosula]|uniref:Uncharacterized protein n=1 Tax=Rubroshorea leprosula TaxID=152421 RepID=A0AAV5K9U3_9ROSI|nr:hypothetical protein SLEP1_g31042 [Rubroshorea leprosula]